ncbi:hypothetical protein C8R42DRAFT_80393 [Lentinula raphanica]|nr:hypothetical protein C8R42DRAFT_80393 [Lentinula raphanica]
MVFAAQTITPPMIGVDSFHPRRHRASRENVRWEEITAKLRQGGLDTIDEEFVGTESTVSSEVICTSHFTPSLLQLTNNLSDTSTIKTSGLQRSSTNTSREKPQSEDTPSMWVI